MREHPASSSQDEQDAARRGDRAGGNRRGAACDQTRRDTRRHRDRGAVLRASRRSKLTGRRIARMQILTPIGFGKPNISLFDPRRLQDGPSGKPLGETGRAGLQHFRVAGAAQRRDADLRQSDHGADHLTLRQRFGVITEKTIRELRGECCIELGETTPARQQILNSRSFGSTVTDIADLQDAIIHFVSHVAKKCRDQHSVASILQIFIQTDRFRTDRPQYCPSISIPLTTPSANTITLGKLALQGLDSIYQTGYHYKRAGVILSEISHAAQSQGDLFAADTSKPELMKTLDALNRRYGKGTVTLGQEGAQHAWQTRQENKSPEYSTNWDQLPVCR